MAIIQNERDLALANGTRVTTPLLGLSLSTALFTQPKNNAAVTPTSGTITAVVTNLGSSPTYTWEYSVNRNPTTWTTMPSGYVSTNVVTLSSANFIALLSPTSSTSLKVRCIADGGIKGSAVSTVDIAYTVEANDPYTIDISRIFAVINASGDGTVASFAGTDTTISAKLGNTSLNYGASGANTFSVAYVVSPTNSITLGSVSNNATEFLMANVTAMPLAVDTGTIVFTITIRDVNGATAYVANRSYTISKARVGDIADGSLTIAKFAAGIRPPEIFAELPSTGNVQGRMVFLTTDNKLYRYTGSAWTLEVDGGDLKNNSVVFGKVAAAAIGVSELAAGAVRAQHVLISPKSLAVDPSFESGTTGWAGFVRRLVFTDPAVPGGCPVSYASEFNSRDNTFAIPIPVVAGEQYKISVLVNKGAGSGSLGLVSLQFSPSGGASLHTDVGSTNTAGWQRITVTTTIVTGATSLVFGPWADRSAYTGEAWYADFSVEKLNDASLIVDGTVTAAKMAVGTITAGSAIIADAAITNAKIDSVTGSKVTTGSLQVGNTLSSSNYLAGALGWMISGNGAAEFDAAIIRGQLTASQINANGLTIRKPDGTVILDASGGSAGLAWTYVNGRPSDDSIKNNLIDTSWWKRDAAIPWSQNGEYNRIVSTLDLGGSFTGPKGNNDIVWYCQETTGDSNSGGGWGAYGISLNANRTYRFAVPIRNTGGSDGTMYWGTSNVSDLNTTNPNGNPYFATLGKSSMSTDRWYLFVGYIFPAGSGANTSESAGVWDCRTGIKISGGTNYCFTSGGGDIQAVGHRAYQFYTSYNNNAVFGIPFINVVDGTEPSLREYFEQSALLNQTITVNGGVLSNIGTSGVQVDNTYQVVGQNLIPNSDQQSAMTWGSGIQAGDIAIDVGLQWSSNIFSSSYTLYGITTRNLVMHQNNIASGDNNTPVIDFYPMGSWGRNYGIPVVAGSKYCFSYYAQAHRSNTGGGISWFDTSGNLITTTELPNTPGLQGSADTLGSYARIFAIATVPSGATVACPYIRKYNTWSGGSAESWIWMAAPQFERVSVNQEGPSPYAPGPALSTRQLGYAGDLDATLGANWNTNIAGKPSDTILRNDNIGITVNADGTISTSGGPSAVGGVTPVGIGAVKTDATNAPSILRNDSIAISDNVITGIGSGSGTEVANSALVPSINTAATTANWSSVANNDGNRPANGATVGATIGTNLNGSFNQTTWDVVMTSALIRSAHIGQLTASNLTVAALTDVIKDGATSTGRVQVTSNRIEVYDDFNNRRVRLGLL
jgi:hypothetical protein